jgi:hypothetical protein
MNCTEQIQAAIGVAPYLVPRTTAGVRFLLTPEFAVRP